MKEERRSESEAGQFMIEIIYRNKAVEKICEDTKEAIRKIGDGPGKKLSKLINALKSAQDLSDIQSMPQYKLHMLKGDRKGVYSLYVSNTRYRLEFLPLDKDQNILEPLDNEMEMFRQTKYIEIIRISNHYE